VGGYTLVADKLETEVYFGIRD